MVKSPFPAGPSRRNLLGGVAISAAAISLPTIGKAQARTEAVPPDVGSKFYPDGRVHPFAGNTIICHLPQQGTDAACFDAMLDVYREATSLKLMEKTTLLPPSSYHMTIFGGAIDQPRKASTWPKGVPIDALIHECDKAVGDRLRAFRSDIKAPIRMRVDPVQDPLGGGAFGFRLLPADAAEARRLAALRQCLAVATGISISQPDTYRFHITLGYKIAAFSEAERADLPGKWRQLANHIASKAPVIMLGLPEYCTFADMFAFHRLFYLA